MIKRVFIVYAVLFLMACGSATDIGEEEREGVKTDIPSRYNGVWKNPEGSQECQEKLIDPEDGTELLLVRSQEGIGSYEVPDGKYGMGSDELLRIDCRTGEVLGVVKR